MKLTGADGNKAAWEARYRVRPLNAREAYRNMIVTQSFLQDSTISLLDFVKLEFNKFFESEGFQMYGDPYFSLSPTYIPAIDEVCYRVAGYCWGVPKI